MRRQKPFLKTLQSKFEHIVKTYHTFKKVNLYFQDESRFGLKTHTGRCITLKGVKPIVTYQHKFQTTYLWGSYSPIDGDSFVWEINGVNKKIWEGYLEALSKHRPEELKILVIDNAGFHSLKDIHVPQNIAFINIPPYSPELNACERMWHYIKSKFKNKVMANMEELKSWLHNQVRSITPKQVKSIVNHDCFVNAFYASL